MTRADRPRRRAVLAGALAALGLLSACDAGNAQTSEPTAKVSSASPDTPRAPEVYVALGDSYTAAPFVPTTDVAGGCFRSNGNYPSLVAARLEPRRFVDVSCGGADSTDLAGRQVITDDASVPPQFRALRRDADLVTVGIGGNDGDLFERLSCSFTRQQAAQCDQVPGTSDVASTLAQTRSSVATALQHVKRTSPDAYVLLVGYPRLVDTTTRCSSLPLRGESQDHAAEVEQQLRATLRAAARDAGVHFLDLWPASRGHEICSDDPWVNGVHTDRRRALAYHPFAAEQEAVARLVEARWRAHAS